MKKFIILIFLFLISCEVYQEPTSLSLSGEYVITKVTLLSTENTTNNSGVIYNPGSHYINPYDIFPIDDIQVGFTRWHLDYSVISFNPNILPSGTVIWGDRYVYSVINHYSNYDLGYIDITMDNGGRRIFKIIDDGVESLVLRTTNNWGAYGGSGPAQSATIYLTRIGP